MKISSHIFQGWLQDSVLSRPRLKFRELQPAFFSCLVKQYSVELTQTTHATITIGQVAKLNIFFKITEHKVLLTNIRPKRHHFRHQYYFIAKIVDTDQLVASRNSVVCVPKSDISLRRIIDFPLSYMLWEEIINEQGRTNTRSHADEL